MRPRRRRARIREEACLEGDVAGCLASYWRRSHGRHAYQLRRAKPSSAISTATKAMSWLHADAQLGAISVQSGAVSIFMATMAGLPACSPSSPSLLQRHF